MSHGVLRNFEGVPLGTPEAIAAWLKNYNEGDINGAESFDKEYAPYYHNPFFRMAARMVRFFGSDFHKMYGEMYQHFPMRDGARWTNDGAIFLPLSRVLKTKLDNGKFKIEIQVFPNIPIRTCSKEGSYDSIETYQSVSFFENMNILSMFMENYNHAVDNPKNKQWDDQARGFKYVKTSNTISVNKYLTTFFKLDELGYKADQIRDLATKIEQLFLPIEVQEALTPSEVVECWQNGPSSCMKSGVNWGAIYLHSVNDKDDTKLFHPALWYHYNPGIRVFYISRAGHVSARCVIMVDKDGNWYAPDTNYSSDARSTTQMKDWLKEHKVKRIEKADRERYVRPIASFDIPAYDYKGQKLCPLPWSDRTHNGWKVSYDQKMDVFHWTINAESNTNLHSQAGFVRPEDLDRAVCKHCGTQIESGSRGTTRTLDGSIYCDPQHAHAGGYKKARQDNGDVVWTNEEGIIMDAFAHGHYFTTITSAFANGARPIMFAHVAPEDDDKPEVSIHGTVVEFHEELYAMREDHILYLQNTKKAGTKRQRNGAYLITGLSSETALPAIKTDVVEGSMRLDRDTGEVDFA
jgi:hypothetical protein